MSSIWAMHDHSRCRQIRQWEMGYSYLRGRNKAQAELAAVIDGLLQTQSHHEQLMRMVIEPLAAMKQEQQQLRAKEVATSKVDFFTMVRGED